MIENISDILVVFGLVILLYVFLRLTIWSLERVSPSINSFFPFNILIPSANKWSTVYYFVTTLVIIVFTFALALLYSKIGPA